MEAIVVDRVSKTFRISTEPASSLKERLIRRKRSAYEEFQALKAIDLRIEQGETIGILGHNGSGKSTLLKCIAGILTPTEGEVWARGRVASLLELGAGFHPDLTGRENVYINAAFYGMGRKRIDAIFDEIVAFAELAQFIDEPVKHYSSGMYVRLGFAVAVHLDPDVLLVDEVLAVGDEAFQVKCLSRIEQFQAEGRTIVFVTHAAETARQVCDRAIVLDHGSLIVDADPDTAIRVLRQHLRGQLGEDRFTAS
ncbi:MAG: ABC transporter ATP-binding protein [Ilumatobacteraceae bacterium]